MVPHDPLESATLPAGSPSWAREGVQDQEGPQENGAHHGFGQARPTHITVVVPPHLQHYHGTLDATAIGASGVWLPRTHFIWPTIWRLKWPPDIKLAVREGRLSMADCESGAYFVQECLLDHLLNGQVARGSTHNFSDNTPMVGRITHHTSRGESPFTEEMLHCLGIRQLITGSGPADCTHSRKMSWATSHRGPSRRASPKEWMTSSWPTSLTISLSLPHSCLTPSQALGSL
jgi:hypothetical protein